MFVSDKPNHWCKICGVGYYACNDCDKTQNWRAYACSVEHYQIYNILAFYNKGFVSKEETVAGLKSLGVTEEQAHTFIDGVRERTLGLLAAAKVPPVIESKSFKKMKHKKGEE